MKFTSDLSAVQSDNAEHLKTASVCVVNIYTSTNILNAEFSIILEPPGLIGLTCGNIFSVVHSGNIVLSIHSLQVNQKLSIRKQLQDLLKQHHPDEIEIMKRPRYEYKLCCCIHCPIVLFNVKKVFAT